MLGNQVRSLLCKYGFSFVCISQGVGDVNAFIRMFKHRVVNYCTLDWQAAIGTSSRCDHNNNFKRLLTFEKIFDYGSSVTIQNCYVRVSPFKSLAVY